MWLPCLHCPRPAGHRLPSCGTFHTNNQRSPAAVAGGPRRIVGCGGPTWTPSTAHPLGAGEGGGEASTSAGAQAPVPALGAARQQEAWDSLPRALGTCPGALGNEAAAKTSCGLAGRVLAGGTGTRRPLQPWARGQRPPTSPAPLQLPRVHLRPGRVRWTGPRLYPSPAPARPGSLTEATARSVPKERLHSSPHRLPSFW